MTGSLVIAGGRRFAVADITKVMVARSTQPWLGFVAVIAPLLTGLALALAIRGGTTLWIGLMGLLCLILAAPLLIGHLTGRDLLEVWIEYRGATVRLTRARSVPHARYLVRLIRLVMRLRGQNATV